MIRSTKTKLKNCMTEYLKLLKFLEESYPEVLKEYTERLEDVNGRNQFR